MQELTALYETPPFPVPLAQHHRAGATIAFRAPFLGAAALFYGAQIFKQRHRRIYIRYRALLFSQQKLHRFAHQLPGMSRS